MPLPLQFTPATLLSLFGFNFTFSLTSVFFYFLTFSPSSLFSHLNSSFLNLLAVHFLFTLFSFISIFSLHFLSLLLTQLFIATFDLHFLIQIFLFTCSIYFNSLHSHSLSPHLLFYFLNGFLIWEAIKTRKK